ncbi:hypothetical protein CFC21_060238 [Triticum aestivum]|uniref:Uncharacterized protein n=2 Tax=Triticum aestivum TaxID=4565 RepID=A0A3B6JEV9_WHEAT|nr:uncharacterized protein LOC123095725 isoform X3 [Triticum aestivum]KAF7052087.1 hypothetical protein CFC21_060238 [Triticum aestivum]
MRWGTALGWPLRAPIRPLSSRSPLLSPPTLLFLDLPPFFKWPSPFSSSTPPLPVLLLPHLLPVVRRAVPPSFLLPIGARQRRRSVVRGHDEEAAGVSARRPAKVFSCMRDLLAKPFPYARVLGSSLPGSTSTATSSKTPAAPPPSAPTTARSNTVEETVAMVLHYASGIDQPHDAAAVSFVQPARRRRLLRPAGTPPPSPSPSLSDLHRSLPRRRRRLRVHTTGGVRPSSLAHCGCFAPPSFLGCGRACLPTASSLLLQAADGTRPPPSSSPGGWDALRFHY